jgi:hypothetical protein
MTWLRRLRHEWTRNDGKPREAWGPGRDLKESVLTGLLIGLTLALVGIVVWWAIKG